MALSAKKVANAAKANDKAKATDDKPKVQLVAPWDLGSHKTGDTLTRPRDLRDYLALAIEKFGQDVSPAKLARIKAATDSEIIGAVETIDQSQYAGDEDTTKEAQVVSAMVDAVLAARFAVDASEVPSPRDIARDPTRAAAQTLGSKLSEETEKTLDIGVKAKKDADACPVLLQGRLAADLGADFVNHTPPIGSAYRPSRPKQKVRPPLGYRAPNQAGNLPIWNGPYQRYETRNLSGEGPDYIYPDWVEDFTAGTPHGKPWSERVDMCREALKEKIGEGVKLPADLAALREEGASEKIQAELDEAAYQFTQRKNYIQRAFYIWQSIAAIKDHYTGDGKATKGIRVDLFGREWLNETAEKAAERRKPYCLTETVVTETGDKERNSKPIPVAKVHKIAAWIKTANLPANTRMGTLLTRKETRGTPEDTAKDVPGQTDVPSIETTDRLHDYLSEVIGYANNKDHFALLRRVALSPKDNGALASLIVSVCQIFGDLAKRPDIRTLAEQFETRGAESKADDTDATKAA